MITEPTIDQLVDAVVAAAPRLDDRQRRIALATYREVATGRTASAEAIARRAGVTTDEAAGQLAEWSGVFRDDGENVVGFWGLAIPDMPHRVRIGGADVHAWCAWDPLFLAHLVGDLAVETTDPVSGETIAYRVVGGVVEDLSHPESVVSFLVPDGEWGDDVQTTFCHHVLHFTDRSTGERWRRDRDGTVLLPIEDAADIGRRYATAVFGGAPR